MTQKERVREIIQRLAKIYPHPTTVLRYKTPWELLVATILSAQTTDKTVNTITPELFKKFPTIKSFADAQISDIDKMISTVNFHTNKARSINGASHMILEKFNGKIPDNMEELDSLPGVARKTANVVLGTAFHKNEGIVVDTHVMRLSKKLKLTDSTDPVKIEQDLMKIVPQEQWTNFSHYLILHGRDMCTARTHLCNECPLGELCPDKKQ